VTRWDSIGDFGRGFNSVFAQETDLLVNPKSSLRKPVEKLSPEAAAALGSILQNSISAENFFGKFFQLQILDEFPVRRKFVDP
jgi:hypothetical protein